MKTPYPSTNVIVLNEDCFVLYERLISERYQPLLLNMANGTNPGGRYRTDDGAQEENLFRRSDYYQSLDEQVADDAGRKKSKSYQQVQNHCLKYSHVCPFDRLCKTKEEYHYETPIHIARKLCSDMEACSNLNDEERLETVSHSDVNFVHNQSQLIKAVNNYVGTSSWNKAKISIEILNSIRALQPVHRCAPHIFESSLVRGNVMSRPYTNLLHQPRYVVKAVQQHSEIRSIIRQHNMPAVKENASKLIRGLVETEFRKHSTHEISKPGTTNGIVITTPASKFEEQIVLPVTISQSRILYCLDRAQTSHNLELIYIYWQAMNGDLILTISNETINPEKDQTKLRCLVCYIAEKPSTTTDDYHEVYSYLNDDNPYQHETNIYTNEFKAKSNVFYRGCNADDFLTFCLKINHNSGKGIFSHAGPNGTYNHETIEYQFDKSELDLSQIDFIHVNAGNQDVPIRNFTINHEPILELHPSSDNDFKLGT
ncbi:unnamed protein product [Rotaria magnacalcarata]|nr:unnamed protein product [Rotaria magnacalcarata]